MAIETRVDTTVCVVCGAEPGDEEFERCMICRSAFCAGCGVQGFGRTFCSTRCRDYFFFGDADEAGDG